MDTDFAGGEQTAADRRKSCNLCCSRKRRCDGDGVNPCSLCLTKGVLCAYSKKGRRGPKPKPKREREEEEGFEWAGMGGAGLLEGGGGGGGIPSLLDWGNRQQDEDQPPPMKMARVANVVRLTPSNDKGVLWLQENRYLDSFFSGFGACTQIVHEDEIRGAMIHVLSESQFGMPNVDGESFYSNSAMGDSGRGEGGDSGDGDHGPGLRLIRLEEGGLGIATGAAAGEGGAETERELVQRTQRASLSARVACLWAGIGVGAMLCGQTAEETAHYAENASEAIKGCHDVVSEEVLRAFLCLAHMHSFREDFPQFFRYTSMAKDVAASLDRQVQEPYTATGSLRKAGNRGAAPKGCSESAKFLLQCFDAMSHFLELEGEETNSPVEGIIAPQSAKGIIGRDSSGRRRLALRGPEENSDGGGGGGASRDGDGRGAREGAGSGSGSNAVSRSAAGTEAGGLAARSGGSTPAASGRSGYGSEVTGAVAAAGSGRDDGRYPDESGDGHNNRRSMDGKGRAGSGDGEELEESVEGGNEGNGDKEKENEPRMSSPNEVTTLTMKARVGGALRSYPSALAYDEFPGLESAVRFQECIRELGDNPVAKRLGNFSISSPNSIIRGKGRSHGRSWGYKKPQEIEQEDGDDNEEEEEAMVAAGGDGGSGGEGGEIGRSGLRSPLQKANQVLFVGDTRILEVSMTVDCSCVSVMCKAVAGSPWADVQADARIVANTADAILVPVLASPSISRSVCTVKLLANSAFSHLCLGNSEGTLRAVRRFSAILKEFPGIIRFAPWRHCFHWMAGILESAGLRDLYDDLRGCLKVVNMKSMRDLPEFGEGAHDIMCRCSHFRCQATHKALAEHAKRNPCGVFKIPSHCPQYGTAARAAAANGSSSTAFRAGREAAEWAAKLSTVDPRRSGGVGIVVCSEATASLQEEGAESSVAVATTPAANSYAPAPAASSRTVATAVGPRPAQRPSPEASAAAAVAVPASVSKPKHPARTATTTAAATAAAATAAAASRQRSAGGEVTATYAAPAASGRQAAVAAAAARERASHSPSSLSSNGASPRAMFGAVSDTGPGAAPDTALSGRPRAAIGRSIVNPSQDEQWRAMFGCNRPLGGDQALGAGMHIPNFGEFNGTGLQQQHTALPLQHAALAVGPPVLERREGSFCWESGNSGRGAWGDARDLQVPPAGVNGGNNQLNSNHGRRHSFAAGSTMGHNIVNQDRRRSIHDSFTSHNSYSSSSAAAPTSTTTATVMDNLGSFFVAPNFMSGGGGSRCGNTSGSPTGAAAHGPPASVHSSHIHTSSSSSSSSSSDNSNADMITSCPPFDAVSLPPATRGLNYSIAGAGPAQLAAARLTGMFPGANAFAVASDQNNFGKTGPPTGAGTARYNFIGGGIGGGAGAISNGRVGGGVFVGSGGPGAMVSGPIGYTAQEQQLWAALSEGPELAGASGTDGAEMSNTSAGQEEADLEIFAQEIAGMLTDEMKAC